jgi:ribosomal protein S16
MKKYVIKLKRRGVFSFNEYDIAVFKQTASPLQSPIAKLGRYKARLGSSFEAVTLNLDLFKYWLAKGAKIKGTVLRLLLLHL